MKAGPICPLRLGTFDSLDYWTDPVLMSSVRPMTAQEIDDIAEQSRLDQGRFRQQSRKRIRPEPRSISLYEYFSLLSGRIKVLSSCRS